MPPRENDIDLGDLRYENGDPVVIGKVESVETIKIEDEMASRPTSFGAVVTGLITTHNGPLIRWLFGLPPRRRDGRKLKRQKEKARRRKLKNGRAENPVR